MHQASRTGRQFLRYAALLLPCLFLLLFFLFPLGAILVRSARISDLSVMPNLGHLARVLWFTIWQAVASTALTLLLALPGAHILARYRFRGKALLRALTTVPFVLPPLIVATAFSSLIGPNGLVNTVLMRMFSVDVPPIDLQHSIWIVLLAHVFYNYSVVLRIVGTFWANLNPRIEQAARVLGASRWRAWWEVTLPQLAPAIAAAALLIFLYCFTSFGVILVLGGPRLATVEVEIYRQAVQRLNLPLAAMLSLVQLLLTFAVMSLYTALQRRAARPIDYRSRHAAQTRPATWQAKAWITINVGLMVALLLAPLATLTWRSFTCGKTRGARSFSRPHPRRSATRSSLPSPPWRCRWCWAQRVRTCSPIALLRCDVSSPGLTHCLCFLWVHLPSRSALAT
jgi:thiamine transport system permease protein